MNLNKNIEIKANIMDYVRSEVKQPITLVDLINKLADRFDNQQLLEAIADLECDNELLQSPNGLYGLPEHFGYVVGRMSITSKGFGFVIPDVDGKEGKARMDDIFIPAVSLHSAMNNDKVLVKPDSKVKEGKTREGEVIKVIERANTKVVGTFESSRTFGFVVPDDTRLTQDIFIEGSNFNGAKVGTKVVAEITKWPTKNNKPEGRIIEVLGRVGAPGVDILSVMRQYDLQESFPEEVQVEASKVETEPNKKAYKNRKDRRDLPIVTIDGEDAKDLDDGVYAEKLSNGNYFLGVYIADVSHYVEEFSPLDNEAYARGTSVYLADRVIPMLPVELSNGICSLNAGVDRLSMCCEMEISPQGKIVKYEISPAVIHVYRRLTYNLVNKILVDKEAEVIKDNQDILPHLENLKAVYEVLHHYRHERGSIDFDLPEIKVKLDEKGRPVALIKREHGLGESIIEACMLAANETVAEHMARKELPFIYRIHEDPSEDKLTALNTLLATFNQHLIKDKSGAIKPKEIQRVLANVEGKPEEKIISAVALRSMQQAKYAAENLGHYGLAAEYYTHFTSPIRRYPDLIVHRLLRAQANGKLTEAQQKKWQVRLPDIAMHTSKRERIATEAERDTLLIKEIEYMSKFIGEEFTGVISGVTAFGIFVELDNGIEGLVHVSTMVNDYYDYFPESYSLVGKASNFQYRLGDEVEVVLVKANIKERSLDFILKKNGIVPEIFSTDVIATPFTYEINTAKPINKQAKVDNYQKNSKREKKGRINKDKSHKGRSKNTRNKITANETTKKAKKKVQSKFYASVANKKVSKKNLAKKARRNKH